MPYQPGFECLIPHGPGDLCHYLIGALAGFVLCGLLHCWRK